MAELNVSSYIPGEALLIQVAGGKASRCFAALEHYKVIYSQLLQTIGGAQTGRSSAQNHDPSRALHFVLIARRALYATATVWTKLSKAAFSSVHFTSRVAPAATRPWWITGSS